MKALIPSAALAVLATVAAAPVFAASPATGLWATPEQGGQVRVEECGNALCIRVVTSKRIQADPNIADVKNKDITLRTRPLKGLLIGQGLTGGPTEWKDGSIYNPEDGNTYKGSMKLEGGTLKLTGCVVFPLCKTQTWTRIQ